MSDGIARHRDFSDADEAASFVVRGVTFHLRDDIPIKNFRQISRMSSALDKLDEEDDDGYTQIFKDIFAKLLLPDSADAMGYALDGTLLEEGSTRPITIGLRKAQDILKWILEVYGLRPTQSSSDS